MPTTIAPPDHDARNPLKDFLIFRVDETDGHPELADDSALEAEAVRYADLVATSQIEEGIHYEVRALFTGALLYSTDDPDDESTDNSNDEAEAKTCTPHDPKPTATR